MIILNKTERPQALMLQDEGVIVIDPMNFVTIDNPAVEEELKGFFDTPTGQALLDNKVLEISSVEKKTDSPTEVPSPRAPENLKNEMLSERSKVGVSTAMKVTESMPIPGM